MSLVVMGANYKTMPLEGLECISIAGARIAGALEQLTAFEGVNGAVVLSTCNRVEAYVDARTDRIGADACRELFGEPIGEHVDEVPDGFYIKRGEDVPRHLFRVVCSLDSQMLGEAQILGQAKKAFLQATELGTCTEVLTRLFKDALSVGKRVRTETAIGQDSVSLSTAAFKAVMEEFGDISACSVLFIGSGEMAELTLPYLREAGVKRYLVASRTMEHARSFAASCDGDAIAFENRYEAIAQSDIVFSMTSADVPVIEVELLEKARVDAGTDSRKLVIVDEAIPRDVQPECGELPGVTLHNLETIGRIIDEGMATRIAAVGDVERMTMQAENEFLSWMQQQNVKPTIQDMYAKGSAIVDGELARAMKSFASLRGEELSPEEIELLEAYGSAVMKKILHGPTARLRREAETADSYYYTGAARYLFGLNTFPPGSSPHSRSEMPCAQDGVCAKGYNA